MLRSALVVLPLLFMGCAAPRPNPWVGPDAGNSVRMEVQSAEPSTEPHTATEDFAQSGPPHQAAPAKQMHRPRERFSLKGGYVDSSDDAFDDGFIINGSWMRPVSGMLSSEVEIGYMDADGSHNGIDRDVWAIPFMANARLNVPLGEKFEIYGGLGLGWFYYDAEARTPSVSVSGDGFLFAGDAYFGGDILLGERFRLGLEGKYYATDNDSDVGGDLDSYVVLLTLGFDR